MSDTVFTEVKYNLDTLVNLISLGEIGLPDIQRPFVWSNAKVRNLFDSMYRGYPIGQLLFWQNGFAADTRTIGTDKKQKPPRLVIVDGQQRLTSLYAVLRSIHVVRENYTTEKISIAFNPLKGNFEVSDAAIQRDKFFIPDISVIWHKDTKITRLIRDYIDGLNSPEKKLTDQDESIIEDAILKLEKLSGYPLTALELIANISEESVSDVFVRINSEGTKLNQADFILTLMSVFWDEGRKELEKFCRDSRVPPIKGSSPFNYLIDPFPDQLLRVSVGLAFKRARLRHVYSILRGKDMETGEFDDTRRAEQFEKLAEAQSRVLNLQHWHDFLDCVRTAGYRSGNMISSQNNLLFAYILYLMGRTEYQVEKHILRKVIARWFFMSSITGRYTGSPESAMEFDLARFREVKDAEKFVQVLNNICDITLTGDFWNMTLPYDLATSSYRSPAFFAYYAAQVILNARVLFSNMTVAEKVDPAIQGQKSLERHHLFPKGHLKTLGITSTRDTNQIANYALLEWGDNLSISDQPPAEYLPVMEERFTPAELKKMAHWHALPKKWQNMAYADFLEKRRELMSKIIEEGFHKLSGVATQAEEPVEIDLPQIVTNGESGDVEFKSTLRTNLHTGSVDKRIEHSILKTIAGFLNTNGGTLIIGISDDGTPLGLAADNFANEDKMNLHLINLIKDNLGVEVLTEVHFHFEDYDSQRVMVVQCGKAPDAVFVKDGNLERFYIRTGPSTTELSAKQAQDYIKKNFS